MRFAIILLAAALLLSPAAAQTGGTAIPTTTLSLGTATPGGGFPLYGNAFAEVMNAADPQITIAPRNTKGSNENIPLLEKGELDLALVAGEPAYEAFAGIGRAKVRLKILTAIYSNPGMFVVRADSPYKTIRDLVGQPVAFGAKGSGLPILARYVLDGLGLRQDEDFKAVYLDRAGDGPAMVEDGRVAALWGAGIGWPGFAAVASSASGARFIAAQRGRGHAHPRQAFVPEADDRARRQLPEAGRADRLARFVEFCPHARGSAGRCRLPAGEDAAWRGGDVLQEARAGLRDDRGEHRRGRAEAGADSSGRDEVLSRDRGGEMTVAP
ncbi:ABC-type nitrate/sulfonate/bicarbonate transport system substrate-binding protein [Bradyrhizobium diazoefficiens]